MQTVTKVRVSLAILMLMFLPLLGCKVTKEAAGRQSIGLEMSVKLTHQAEPGEPGAKIVVGIDALAAAEAAARQAASRAK